MTHAALLKKLEITLSTPGPREVRAVCPFCKEPCVTTDGRLPVHYHSNTNRNPTEACDGSGEIAR